MKIALTLTVALSAGLSQPVLAAESGSPAVKERQYRSDRPLYFRAVFDKDGKASVLGVFDESGGKGAGYDVAYVDENRNGDLTDEQAKPFPSMKYGKDAGKPEPRVSFKGPFKGGRAAECALNVYSLPNVALKASSGKESHFYYSLDIDGWSAFFINGKMNLFSSAAEALKGAPVQLAGDYRWEISASVSEGKTVVAAGLKDQNGCTLRMVRGADKERVPMLALSQNGAISKKPEKMEFG